MMLHAKHLLMLFLLCFVAVVLSVGGDGEDHNDMDKAAIIAADQVTGHVVSLSTSFLIPSATESSFPGDFHDNVAEDGNDVEDFTFLHNAEVPAWITCDSKGAPLAKAGVQIEWIDPFCKAVGDQQIHNFTVTDSHKDSGVTIRLRLGTKTPNWVYAPGRDMCNDIFMRILHKCTKMMVIYGGHFYTEHIFYDILVEAVG
ncbi:hypothetical protein WHR41_00304 [Cladosporium halotolerans]|uniref:Transmembrane protein n=1 Tax=Cladosporium halotolerans TaxID=1052096 RepID=A0AB34L7E9_9PEZI